MTCVSSQINISRYFLLKMTNLGEFLDILLEHIVSSMK